MWADIQILRKKIRTQRSDSLAQVTKQELETKSLDLGSMILPLDTEGEGHLLDWLMLCIFIMNYEVIRKETHTS